MEAANRKYNSRLYYIDYLRTFIIFLVVFLHSMLPHVEGYIWYVSESETSSLFALLSILIDVFIMPIMFFIAGYFTYKSLKKYGAKEFIRKKIYRIVLPYILGVLFLSPIMGYLSVLVRGTQIGYFDYWRTTYFNNFISSEHAAHYWFLALLFIFYLSFVLIYRFHGDKIDTVYDKKNSINGKQISLFLAGFFVVNYLFFFIVSFISPDGSWTSLFNILVFQPTRATIYVMYFYLGIYVYLKNINISQKVSRKFPILFVSTLLLSLGYLAFKINFMALQDKTILLKFANSVLHVSLCFAIFITLLVFFKKYLNKSYKPLRRIAKTSYSIYFIHMIIAVIFQYLFFYTSVSIYTKTGVTFVMTLILSYLISEIYKNTYSYILMPKRSVKKFEKQSS